MLRTRVHSMRNLIEGRFRAVADWLGIAASSACAIHCIVLPAVLVSGTVLPASILSDEAFHFATIWIILPAALLAFGIGCRRHKDPWVFILGLIGLAGIFLSATVLHDVIGEFGERAATMISAAVLIVAHYRNFRICRSLDCAHKPE